MEEDIKETIDFLDITEVILPKYSTAKPKYCISEEFKIAVKNILNRLEQDERVIEEAIEFIKDNCIEEIADMKGHYREVASIGDLEELLNILNAKES